jgi:two-component system CheB/CheR fusion protein
MDRDMIVRIWNQRAGDLWGLRTDEVRGKNFFNLDIGLPTDSLLQPVRACLADGSSPQEVSIPATNRRGKAFRCRVTCTPMQTTKAGGHGGDILLMEEADASGAADGQPKEDAP